VRSHVAALLRSFGYDVVEAGDGPAALAQLEGRPDIAMLFSDVIMPGGLDGFELARQASQAAPQLKVLLTTGYAEKAVDADGAAVAYPRLRKPYRKAVLLAAIRAALDGEPVLT
jgi:CheY-like chemotaxis protein